MDLKNKILSKTEELFMRYGIKSITMDEVARKLGISKKTLYKYVDNKADLIAKVIGVYIEREKEIMLDIKSKATDAIEEMMMMSQHIHQQLQGMNPTAVYDLQKYYYESWELINSLQDEFTYNLIQANIQKGIQEGVYRKTVDADVIARFYVGSAHVMVDKNLFPVLKYEMARLHNVFIEYHLHGIASEKGLERLQQYKKIQNNQPVEIL